MAGDARRSRDLPRRLMALGVSFAESRGERFARRHAINPKAKAPPTLADIVNLPDWILCDSRLTDDIAAITALLHFRQAIDQELSGAKLRGICDAVGEAYYDLACATPMPATALMADASAKLPTPERLTEFGRAMLYKALPKAMAVQFDKACGDFRARDLSNIAAAMVVAHNSVDEAVAA